MTSVSNPSISNTGFPVQPDISVGSSSERAWLWPIGSLLVFAAVLISRRWSLFVSPVAWAEDSEVFFPEAMRLGTASLIEPFNAYHVTLIRVLAWFASLFPISWTAEIYVYGSLVVWLGVAVLLWCLRFDLPRWAHATVVLSLVLVPHGGEIWMNLKNIQWVTAVLLVAIALAHPPRQKRARAFWLLVFVLAAMTGPFVVFFLPVFLMRCWRADDRPWRWTLAGLAILACVLHIFALFAGRRSETLTHSYFTTESIYPMAKAIYAYIGGLFHARPDVVPMVPVVIIMWAILLAVAFKAWRSKPSAISAINSTNARDPRRIILFLAVVCAWLMGFYGGVWSLRETFFFRPLGVPDANGGPRYSYLPYVMTLWILIWLTAKHEAPRIRLVAGFMAAYIMFGVFFGGRYVAVTPVVS